MKKLAILTAATAILAGCAQAPINYYTPREGIPTATLSNELLGAFGRNDLITVDVWDEDIKLGQNRGMLFMIKQGTSTPTGSIQVAANVPLALHYYESASANRTCSIDIGVTFEPGKQYALTGGFLYEKGPIPIFTDTRKCQLGIVDKETKQPVPIRKVW